MNHVNSRDTISTKSGLQLFSPPLTLLPTRSVTQDDISVEEVSGLDHDRRFCYPRPNPTTDTTQDVKLKPPLIPPPNISVEDFVELFFPRTPSFVEMEDSEEPEADNTSPLYASEQVGVVEVLSLPTKEDFLELCAALEVGI